MKEYLISRGVEVVDNREKGGVLWVICKDEYKLREVVDDTVKKFGITGVYARGKATKNQLGWYTKTKK